MFQNTSLRRCNRDRIIFVGILLLVLLPLEVRASMVAWETLGSVTSGFLIAICILLNLLALALSLWRFWPGIAVMVSWGLIIVWNQVTLAIRMHYVRAEAAEIVDWAYSQKRNTGSFPSDLSQYVFLRPDYEKYIQFYERIDSERFKVVYYVGTKATSHWYDSESGWHYYPD